MRPERGVGQLTARSSVPGVLARAELMEVTLWEVGSCREDRNGRDPPGYPAAARTS